MRPLTLIKNANALLVNIINFVLVLIIYVFGVGLSFLLYKLSKKQTPSKTYWINEVMKKEDYVRQI